MSSFKEIINSSTPVLVDFHATWCGPCKVLSPILKSFKNEMGDKVKVIKIDVDKNQALAGAYNVKGVPTVIMFKDGEVKWRKSGVLQLEEMKYLSSAHV